MITLVTLFLIYTIGPHGTFSVVIRSFFKNTMGGLLAKYRTVLSGGTANGYPSTLTGPMFQHSIPETVQTEYPVTYY